MILGSEWGSSEVTGTSEWAGGAHWPAPSTFRWSREAVATLQDDIQMTTYREFFFLWEGLSFLQGQSLNITYSEYDRQEFFCLGVKSSGHGDLTVLYLEFKIIFKLFLTQYLTSPFAMSWASLWLPASKSVSPSSWSLSKCILICDPLMSNHCLICLHFPEIHWNFSPAPPVHIFSHFLFSFMDISLSLNSFAIIIVESQKEEEIKLYRCNQKS